MKYICLLVVLFCVAGCKNAEKANERKTIRVSVLRGPSAIALAQCLNTSSTINGKTISITFADSPDIIQAALIKKETDIAVLPMISAANLYNKGIHYSLLGCPLWGTLYLVGKNTALHKNVLHLFGTGTTPNILARYYIDRNNLPYVLNYSFSTAREVLQALLVGKSEMAVLSEPFVSTALQKDTALHIIADLNNPGDGSSTGFPQTAIVYHASLSKDVQQLDSLFRSSCLFAIEHPEETIQILEKHRVFAPGMLTPEGLLRCKVNYKTAQEAQYNISSFLQLINQYEPKALGGKLPDAGFISGGTQ